MTDTITTAAELDALPAQTVGRWNENGGCVWEKHISGRWYSPSDSGPYCAEWVARYPLTLIFRPDAEPARTEPPQRCAPSAREIITAIFACGLTGDVVAAVEGLLAAQPTVEQVQHEAFTRGWEASLERWRPTVEEAKAEGWDDGFKAAATAHSLMLSGIPYDVPANPYRSEADHGDH